MFAIDLAVTGQCREVLCRGEWQPKPLLCFISWEVQPPLMSVSGS